MSRTANHNREQAIQDAMREGLASGQAFRLLVTSNSMSPLIRAGDAVQVRAAPLDTLRPGDILVLNEAGGGSITHRLMHVSHEGSEVTLHTRGDRVGTPDPAWPRGALAGRVEAIIRGDRSLSTGQGWAGVMHRGLAAVATLDHRLCCKLPAAPMRWFGRILARATASLLSWLAWLGAGSAKPSVERDNSAA